MSESKLAIPVANQIRTVMNNERYSTATRAAFIRDVFCTISSYTVSIIEESIGEISRSEYDQLKGERREKPSDN